MVIVGVTGGSGAGKSTFCAKLKALGAEIFDADLIYRELLTAENEMLREIEKAFPGVTSGSELDRRKLADLVYGNPQALERLNTVTHKFVIDEINRCLDRARAENRGAAVIEAIYLIESGFSSLCDITVAVTAPVGERTARIMKRDNISEEHALNRIKSQKPDEFYTSRCDITVDNANKKPIVPYTY